MFKIIIFFTIFTVCLAGIIDHHHHQHHDFGKGEHHEEYSAHLQNHHSEPESSETDIHHEVDHKHATSHQSFKIHHFHPVPVYIKKEDHHYIKNPVELGGTKLKLKVLHPETEHHHGHGLVLENHHEMHHHDHGEFNHYHHE